MKKIKYLFTIAAVLVLIAFVGGCVTPGHVETNKQVEPVSNIDTSHPRAKLVTGSNKILGRVVILNPRFRTLGKLSQAEVTVQNLTENRYVMEYKFDWADPQGFTVDSHSVWHRFILTPHQMQNFNSTGKTPEARNIIFTIRLPHDAFIEQKE